MNGFICIDKPHGISSFGAVHSIRKSLKTKKAGHAGTLDPAATGLLVVALGDYTRLLPYMPLEPKVYEFGVKFGVTTDTLDCEGTLSGQGAPIPDAEQILSSLPDFVGLIQQTPPAFSAIKIDGKRAYALARSGETVAMQSRPITVHSLELQTYDKADGCAMFKVTCGSGTYVRSLARDIALACNSLAYATSIRRVKTGAFNLENALYTLEQDYQESAKYILTIKDVVPQSQIVVLSESQLSALKFGKDVTLESPDKQHELLYGLSYKTMDLAAVLRVTEVENCYHPDKVFITGL